MNDEARNELEIKPITALAPVERASMALSSALYEPKLLALVHQSAAIVTITNKAAYEECHAARMRLKRERTRIEQDGKAARDDATVFARAVVAEEKRLIGIIRPEEERLQQLQDAEDKRVADEKEATRKREAQRIATITDKIQQIKRWPSKMLRLDSAGMLKCINELKDVVSADAGGVWLAPYAEYGEEAKNAYESALEYMGETLDAKIAQEKDDAERRARLEEEREERRLLEEQQQMTRAAELERQAEAERVRAGHQQNWRALMTLIDGGGPPLPIEVRIQLLEVVGLTEQRFGDRLDAAQVARDAGVVTWRDRQRQHEDEAQHRAFIAARQVFDVAAARMYESLPDPIMEIAAALVEVEQLQYGDVGPGRVDTLDAMRRTTLEGLQARKQSIEATMAAQAKRQQERQEQIDEVTSQTNAWEKADARLVTFRSIAQGYRHADKGLELLEAYRDLVALYRKALTPTTAAKRSHKKQPSTPKEQA